MPAPKQLLTGFAKTALTSKPDPAKRLTIRDPESRGLFVRINPAGGRSWIAMARDPSGKQVWATIGDAFAMELPEAREKGREAVQRIKAGQPATAPAAAPPKAPETFKQVAERFLERHVDKRSLRGAPETKRQFKRYIYPEWEAEPFTAIRRGKVVELLNRIEDNNGPVMADRVSSPSSIASAR